MTCAACSARVEKAVAAVPGVTSVSVSLLTNSMGVEGEASPAAVVAAVERAGYGAAPASGMSENERPDSARDLPEDRTATALLTRLCASAVLLLALMYLAMGHGMWGWPLPSALADNAVAFGLAQCLLAAGIMVINQRFFISGVRGVLHGAPNMDTLVSLGAGAAFVYSTAVLFAMSAAQMRGDAAALNTLRHDLYFESTGMILTLITVGKLLEARSKGRTTDALRALIRLAPRTATVLTDGEERTIPASQVTVGATFLVRTGETVPVDGVIEEGTAAIDEAALTGESVPVDKVPGDAVSAATLNRSGFLRCRATRVGQDTTLSQIIRMVEDAAATKAPIARAADTVSGVFVPVVMGIALITVIAWLLLGREIGDALARGIAVLVISCPCALGLATPVAIMVGNGVAARHGVLFKTAAALENTGRTEIVVLDKTGTVTRGEPRVTDICPAEGTDEEVLLTFAASLERASEHPLGEAVRRCAGERGIRTLPVSEVTVLPGSGLTAQVDGHTVTGGNAALIASRVSLPPRSVQTAERLAAEGKTPLWFAREDRLLGMIAVADVIKEDSAAAVAALRRMGIRVVMLTGDNARTAAAIGSQAGIDEVIADVLPDGKEEQIRRLMAEGKTVMVGDGINDAPALTRADVGMAIGAGTDVAIDAADVVLMHSRLSDVPAAIRLGRATLRNIRENLFWAFLYNVIGIPLAAGAFGWRLDPMFGAAAMSLSSFCVVTNALRLNLFRFSADKNKERETMEKTLKIEGMMCVHCEAHVKQALEALPGVESAVASHEAGTATVTLTQEVSDEALAAAVVAAGYRVV